MKRLMTVASLMALLLANAFVSPAPTRANTSFTVNSTLDEIDATPGDGLCVSTPSGLCTLRAAVMEANVLAGADTINLPTGIYVLTIPGVNENTTATGDLDISAEVTLTGADFAVTVIDGGQIDRVIDVMLGAIAYIQNVTIRNGKPVPPVGFGYGAGIQNGGRLTLANSVVISNVASGAGGGIYSYNPITITNSTLQDNYAEYGGGGIYSSGTALLIGNAVISNSAGTSSGTWGGGVWAYGTATLVNTTVSGNSGGVNGVRSSGTITLTNSTIANTNGIVAPPGDKIYLRNTVIADSCSGAPGTLISQGYNLLNNCFVEGDTTGNISGDPLLSSLQNNGGPTLTHALLLGSPAIDAGNPAGCTDASGNPLTTDQRGVARPQGSACDMGAFERVQTCDGGGTPVSLPFKLYLPIITRYSTTPCP